MKRQLQMTFFFGILLFSINANAQSKQQDAKKLTQSAKTTKTYFDLMVNVVSTDFNYGRSNSALADYKKSSNGIQAGASFQAGITPTFSVVSELYFMKKGGKLTTGNPLTDKASSLTLNSLELPALARFYLGKFYVNAGPSIGYNLGGTTKIGDKFTRFSLKDADEDFKRFDAGIQLGGGVEFPFNQKRIALDVRYTYGLTNISNDREIHNRAIMVSVHFSKPWKTNPFSGR